MLPAVPPLIPGSGLFQSLQANYAYLDSIQGPLVNTLNIWKGIALAASTTNVQLFGLQTIDGVVLASENLVLLKNQTNEINNGLYRVKDVEWERSSNLINGTNASGIAIYITNSSLNESKVYVCTNISGNDIVGSSGLNFASVANGGINYQLFYNNDGNLETDTTTTDGIGNISAMSLTASGSVIASSYISGNNLLFDINKGIYFNALTEIKNDSSVVQLSDNIYSNVPVVATRYKLNNVANNTDYSVSYSPSTVSINITGQTAFSLSTDVKLSGYLTSPEFSFNYDQDTSIKYTDDSISFTIGNTDQLSLSDTDIISKVSYIGPNYYTNTIKNYGIESTGTNLSFKTSDASLVLTDSSKIQSTYPIITSGLNFLAGPQIYSTSDGISINNVLDITETQIVSSKNITALNYPFTSNVTSGLFSSTANTIDMNISGSTIVKLDTKITSQVPIRSIQSYTSPSFAFSSDTDSGIYTSLNVDKTLNQQSIYNTGTCVSVSIDGTTLVLAFTQSFSVYTLVNNVWTFQQLLDSVTDKIIGSVSLKNNSISVSIPYYNFIKIYNRTGITWTFQTNKLGSTESMNSYTQDSLAIGNIYPSYVINNKLIGPNIGSSNEGWSISLSANGSVMAVGGPLDNSNIGAVWIYNKVGNNWVYDTKIVGTGFTGTPRLGFSVSLNSTGNILAIGGPFNQGLSGLTWIFQNISGTWTQLNALGGSGSIGNAFRGSSVCLSVDGTLLAVGGTLDNNGIGATWVFTQQGGSWSNTPLQIKLVGTGSIGQSRQGESISLSDNGTILTVGGSRDNGFLGATWIFTQQGGSWSNIPLQRKLVGTSNIGSSNQGKSLSLSSDGTILAVGGWRDNSDIGATWIFTQQGGSWSNTPLEVKLINTRMVSQGFSVSLSGDGTLLAIGSSEDGTSIYYNILGKWIQEVDVTNEIGNSFKGWTVCLSRDSNVLATSGINDNSGIGAVWAYDKYSTGTSYILTQQVGNWNLLNGYITNDSLSFGKSISFYQNTLAIGSDSNTYVYISGTLQSTISSPGTFVSLYEDTLAICNSLINVYTRSLGVWSLNSSFNVPDTITSLSMYGNNIAVGTVGTIGIVYVYQYISEWIYGYYIQNDDVVYQGNYVSVYGNLLASGGRYIQLNSLNDTTVYTIPSVKLYNTSFLVNSQNALSVFESSTIINGLNISNEISAKYYQSNKSFIIGTGIAPLTLSNGLYNFNGIMTVSGPCDLFYINDDTTYFVTGKTGSTDVNTVIFSTTIYRLNGNSTGTISSPIIGSNLTLSVNNLVNPPIFQLTDIDKSYIITVFVSKF